MAPAPTFRTHDKVPDPTPIILNMLENGKKMYLKSIKNKNKPTAITSNEHSTVFSVQVKQKK